MIVIISDRASNDLDEIAAYIARDAPGRSASFVDRLLAACDGLATFPLSYPLDHRFGPDARRRNHGSYRIIYDVQAERVEILAIVHAARDPDNIL